MIVLAFDQSYQRTGVAVAKDDKLICCESYELKFADKKMKRLFLRIITDLYQKLYNPNMIVVERVRTFSGGNTEKKRTKGFFMSTSTIIALGCLVSSIVDSSKVPGYSADTRSWKSRVLGSAKADKNDAVKFIKKLGFDVDHDAADAGCMALYPFKKGAIEKLKEEK